MNEQISSIWDRWEKQCFGRYRHDEDGSTCAYGYVRYHEPTARLAPIAAYIEKHYPVPYAEPISIIAYANDELRLTPEQFREIDRLTQVESATKSLIESVALEDKLSPAGR